MERPSRLAPASPTTSTTESLSPSMSSAITSTASNASSSSETPRFSTGAQQNQNEIPSSSSFGTKTREWISSLSTTTTASASTTDLHQNNSMAARSYYNLDRGGGAGSIPNPITDGKNNRMPDLLMDQSPMDNKRVWIGGEDTIILSYKYVKAEQKHIIRGRHEATSVLSWRGFFAVFHFVFNRFPLKAFATSLKGKP